MNNLLSALELEILMEKSLEKETYSKKKEKNYKPTTRNFCEFPNCKKLAYYNFIDKKIPIRCSYHKEKYMCHTDRKCKSKMCTFIPSFTKTGKFNKYDSYCKKHAPKKYIRINKTKCFYPGCITEATYNYENLKKRLYCKNHKKEEMVNLIRFKKKEEVKVENKEKEKN